jgi:hypothetical protein
MELLSADLLLTKQALAYLGRQALVQAARGLSWIGDRTGAAAGRLASTLKGRTKMKLKH